MAATLEQAITEIYGLLKTDWDLYAGVTTGESPAPLLIFEEVDRDQQPDYDPPGSYGRAVIRHNGSEQTSLGGIGNRCFTRTGTVFIQCFSPWKKQFPKNGPLVARDLAKLVQDAYEGKATQNVWFRQVRLIEVGRDGPYYQVNVASNFEWYERK